ncbi:MAG: hypothetical protein J5930_00465 [Treponema sp.]|nr:hypothetical protein [Treponema sp.]
MAEKKQHKIVSASTGEDVTGKKRPSAAAAPAKSGNATGLRVGAVILWIAALAFEVLAVALILEKLLVLPKIDPLYKGIAALVLDMVCVIIGSQLWKKANHIDPASQKNAVKFWLWNNMGVIVAAVAFIPFIIILLTNKDADKKTKVVGTVVAAIFLAISGLASYDWNPVSQEAVAAATAGQSVYWTEHGKKFHTHEDCQALDRTETLYNGTAQEAIDAGKGTICKFCEKRDAAALEAAQEAIDGELPAAANE